MNSRFQKFIISFLTILVVFLIAVPLLFSHPQPVKGLGAVDILFPLKWTWERLVRIYDFISKQGGAVAYRNVINVYMSELAKQTSQWAATGFKGQKPAFITNPTEFKEKLRDDLVGEFIDEIAQGSFLNQSLCDAIDPTIKLRIILSLGPPPEMPPAREELCSFSQIKARLQEVSRKKLFDIDFDLREGTSYNVRAQLKSMIDLDKTLNTGAKIVFENWYAVLDWRQKKLEKIYTTTYDSLVEEVRSDVNRQMNQEKVNKLIDELEQIEEEYQQRLKGIEEIKNLQLAASCKGKNKKDFCASEGCRFFCPLEENEKEVNETNVKKDIILV